MVIQVLLVDPSAQYLTDDEIISMINNAASAISRVDALDYDALNIVLTGPPSGSFKVKKVHVDENLKIAVSYDDVPIV